MMRSVERESLRLGRSARAVGCRCRGLYRWLQLPWCCLSGVLEFMCSGRDCNGFSKSNAQIRQSNSPGDFVISAAEEIYVEEDDKFRDVSSVSTI